MRGKIAPALWLALTACAAEPAPERNGAADAAFDTAGPAAAAPASSAAAALGSNAAVAGSAPHDGTLRPVVFLGTSLTAGYGVGAENGFPARIQERIDAAGLPFRVVNAGVSGATTAGGLSRLEWTLQQPVDVLVLELGANDGLRGLSPDTMRANLAAILRRTKERYPESALVLAGMEAPPNMGATYTARYRNVFRELAAAHDAALIPFLLDGVATEPAFNQNDGIHPNVDGHRRIADVVWQTLGPLLRARAGQRPGNDQP